MMSFSQSANTVILTVENHQDRSSGIFSATTCFLSHMISQNNLDQRLDAIVEMIRIKQSPSILFCNICVSRGQRVECVLSEATPFWDIRKRADPLDEFIESQEFFLYKISTS